MFFSYVLNIDFDFVPLYGDSMFLVPENPLGIKIVFDQLAVFVYFREVNHKVKIKVTLGSIIKVSKATRKTDIF